MKGTTYPLPLSGELLDEVRKASRDTGLSLAETIRQSIKLGIPAVRQKLGAQRVTHVEPLSDKVLERLYRARDEEADPEGLKKLMNAQPIRE